MHKLEVALLTTGLTLLGTFLAFRIHSVVASRAALQRFEAAAGPGSGSGATASPRDETSPDFSDWDQKRIDDYKQSLVAELNSPIGVLTIRKVSLEVPVFDGTDELVLNRGAGRIIGTAKPGQAGNMGIAGHRDGFFRCLKDLHLGDRIELKTRDGICIYDVDNIGIVTPDDVSVLRPENQPALTLVTCYPFYFIGHAPYRYIVHASKADPDQPEIAKQETKPEQTRKQEIKK